jgi:hypothetical protein
MVFLKGKTLLTAKLMYFIVKRKRPPAIEASFEAALLRDRKQVPKAH